MALGIELVGDGLAVPCVDGVERPYLNLDAAASTSALSEVAERVAQFLPWYSSVHRGAGYKSQLATDAYESAREQSAAFAGRAGSDDVAIICRNTTEAINHLAYRLRLAPGRTSSSRPSSSTTRTSCRGRGSRPPVRRMRTGRHLRRRRRARGARRRAHAAAARHHRRLEHHRLAAAVRRRSSATRTSVASRCSWTPPSSRPTDGSHRDADFLAFSGHKMYAPYGAGALARPARRLRRRRPVPRRRRRRRPRRPRRGRLDRPARTRRSRLPQRPRSRRARRRHRRAAAASAGTPIQRHDDALARKLRAGLASIPGVRVLGPELAVKTLPVATFVVDGVPHALVAARLSAEFAIGVRHGCFCAHPYLIRLLGLSGDDLQRFREAARHHDRRSLPGAVRASAGLSTTAGDIERLLKAVETVASTTPPVEYLPEPLTGTTGPNAIRDPTPRLALPPAAPADSRWPIHDGCTTAEPRGGPRHPRATRLNYDSFRPLAAAADRAKRPLRLTWDALRTSEERTPLKHRARRDPTAAQRARRAPGKEAPGLIRTQAPARRAARRAPQRRPLHDRHLRAATRPRGLAQRPCRSVTPATAAGEASERPRQVGHHPAALRHRGAREAAATGRSSAGLGRRAPVRRRATPRRRGRRVSQRRGRGHRTRVDCPVPGADAARARRPRWHSE